MTTLTLRRAAQVFNRILAETQFEVPADENDYYSHRRHRTSKKQTLTATATINVDDPRQRADHLRTTLLDKKHKMFRLLTIGTQIRQAVAEKQASCGVSALVTERVAVVQKQQILDTLVKSIETDVYEPAALAARAEAVRNRLSVVGNSQIADTIITPLLTASDRTDLLRELADVRRRLLEIDDRLAELNSTNSISVLTDDSYEYLRELGIA